MFCKKHSVHDKNFNLNSVWLNQDMKIVLQLINEYSKPSPFYSEFYVTKTRAIFTKLSFVIQSCPALVFSCARQLVQDLEPCQTTKKVTQ